jgi:hypothetical protein
VTFAVKRIREGEDEDVDPVPVVERGATSDDDPLAASGRPVATWLVLRAELGPGRWSRDLHGSQRAGAPSPKN